MDRALDAAPGRRTSALHLVSALLKIEDADRDGAAEELAAAHQAEDTDHRAAAVWVQSLLSHNVADAAIAESRLASELQRSPRALSSSGTDGRLLRAARVRIHLLLGRSLDDLPKFTRLTLSDHVISAAIAHLRGDERAAFELSDRVIDAAAEPRLQSNALLIHAACALRLGYAQTAHRSCVAADAIIRHYGLPSNYESIPAHELVELFTLADLPAPEPSEVRQARRDLPHLTRRENDILAFLLTEMTLARIADALHVSPNTLKTMLRRLYRKLGVSTRREAADFALHTGWRHQR